MQLYEISLAFYSIQRSRLESYTEHLRTQMLQVYHGHLQPIHFCLQCYFPLLVVHRLLLPLFSFESYFRFHLTFIFPVLPLPYFSFSPLLSVWVLFFSP